MCLFMSMLYDKIKSEFDTNNNNGLLLDVTWEHYKKNKRAREGKGTLLNLLNHDFDLFLTFSK